MIINLIITYHHFKRKLRQNKFNRQHDQTINHDINVNNLKGMNNEGLIFKIKIEKIKNEMIKIELNFSLNEIRKFSTTNDNVHCTTISHFALSKKKQRSMFMRKLLKFVLVTVNNNIIFVRSFYFIGITFICAFRLANCL